MTANEFNQYISEAEKPVSRLSEIGISDLDFEIRNIVELFNDFKTGGEALLREGDVLKIGIVGQVKAGKSSFLNSLVFNGDTVLPKASTPMTAGLTVLEYADSNSFEVDYYTPTEWNEFQNQADVYKRIEQEIRSEKDFADAPETIIKKELRTRTSEVMQSAYEMVAACGPIARSKIGKPSENVTFDNIKDLQTILGNYVGAKGDFTSVVKSLTIKMHDDRLKGIRIVDTPGVNDPIVSRENRTKEFLHSCHGVFFLSYSSRFFDSMDVSFMNTRIGNQGIGTVVMLASKYDDVLQDQGNKYHDDIERADENSNSSLRKRYETQRSQLTNPDIDMVFDTTSGISFALATKPRCEWDDMEQHVDSRMHAIFPSAFTDEECSRETYLMLANVETIRNEYLENKFKDNKETIISGKINDYFCQNSQELSTSTSRLIDDAESKLKEIESTDLRDIYRQQSQQEKMFSTLKGEFETLLGTFQDSLQTNKDRLYEEIPKPVFYTLPTFEQTVNVTHKGALWGHNTSTFEVRSVDTQNLKESSIELLEKYCKDWQSSWKELFASARDRMFDQFCERITEFSKNISDLKFSDRYYRQLMTQLLSSIERYGVIKLQDIKNKYQQQIAELCDSQNWVMSDRSYECKNSQVQDRLNRDANDMRNNLQRVFNNKLDSFSREVSNEVENCIVPVHKHLNDLKANIEPSLKTVGAEYLDNLKKQIEDKEKTKAEIESLLSLLKELKKLENHG